MRTITTRHLQHHLADVLDLVAHGEAVTITRRRTPLARLSPILPDKRRIKHPDYMARLDRIYGRRVLPDSQPVLDEIREARF